MILNFIKAEKSSTLFIAKATTRLMIDPGPDITEQLFRIFKPTDILISQANTESVNGMANLRSKTNIHITEMNKSIVNSRKLFELTSPTIFKEEDSFKAGVLRINSYPVKYSAITPALGFVIDNRVWYSPNVLLIPKKEQALQGLGLFIGDGTSVSETNTIKVGQELTGHASMMAQLTWARTAKIPNVVFTNLSSQVVNQDKSKLIGKLNQVGLTTVRLAFSGMVL